MPSEGTNELFSEEESPIPKGRRDSCQVVSVLNETPVVDFGPSEMDETTTSSRAIDVIDDESVVVSLAEVERATKQPQYLDGLTIGDACVSTASLRTLDGAKWVNDEVMSAFFTLLQREDGVVAFSPRLMAIMQSKTGLSEDTMRRWWARSAGCTLDQAKIIITPVHVDGNHWIVVCANTATRVITSYCSLGRNDYGKYNAYTAIFLLAQKPSTEHELAWNSSSQSVKQARQRDSNECGIFACMTAMRLAKGLPPDSYTAAQVYEDKTGRRIIRQSLQREALHDLELEAPVADSSGSTILEGVETPAATEESY